ncbi:RRP15-like protein [Pogonomyrmex barbatus]|uniref:RRP15-like protein n=1 Tax=Pogonomyrmex barbatus TaxID=144034 RepID=A0A6I9W1C0_9HYME|nr:RRP15-like protein [Pogonomyrmex barbatus]
MILTELATKLGNMPKKMQVKSEIEEINAAAAENVNSDYEENEEDESDSIDMKDNTDNNMSHNAESTVNAGWADVMQKILKTNKPKGKKTLVLAKAKKLYDLKTKEKEEDISFEIDGIKAEVKTESDEASNKKKQCSVQTKSRIREKNLSIRLKPSITDREHERMLQKIATKGVVQLFNAVKQQQTVIQKKLVQAGPLERKREQIYKSINKNDFLDILMGGNKSIKVDNPVKSEKPVEQTNDKNKDNTMWSVLRDDFVMGAKLKDWDKKEAEEDSSAPEGMDSD